MAFRPIQASLDPNYTILQEAVTQLSAQPTIFFQLSGSTTYRGRTVPFVTSFSWSLTTTGTQLIAQAEMESWVNGTLMKRLVGDGNTFWTYDLSSHQYSATPYGGLNGKRSDTYVTDFLNNLNLATSGNDTFLTKLLRQIYNPAVDVKNKTDLTNSPLPTYESWMPGTPSVALPLGQTNDPINPQITYAPTLTDHFIMYSRYPKRSIVFEISEPVASADTTTTTTNLETVYFNQLDTILNLQRLTQWQIKVYTGLTFASDLFTPYSGQQTRGWHPVPAVGPIHN